MTHLQSLDFEGLIPAEMTLKIIEERTSQIHSLMRALNETPVHERHLIDYSASAVQDLAACMEQLTVIVARLHERVNNVSHSED